MANSNRRGFWPVGTLSGSPWQGSVKRFNHGYGEAVIMGIGDMCELESTGFVYPCCAFLLHNIGTEPGIHAVGGIGRRRGGVSRLVCESRWR